MPSSVIRRFHYDMSAHELRVIFQSGREYLYRNVPPATFTAMRACFSKGEFFNRYIRDHFAFVRDPPPRPARESSDEANPARRRMRPDDPTLPLESSPGLWRRGNRSLET